MGAYPLPSIIVIRPRTGETAMKEKLTLALDDLAVTTFEATPDAQGLPEVTPSRNTGCATCYTNCLPYC